MRHGWGALAVIQKDPGSLGYARDDTKRDHTKKGSELNYCVAEDLLLRILPLSVSLHGAGKSLRQLRNASMAEWKPGSGRGSNFCN
jgi:hypothetical protein